MQPRTLGACWYFTILMCLLVGSANGDLVVSFSPSGADVVVTLTGSLDLTGLSTASTSDASSGADFNSLASNITSASQDRDSYSSSVLGANFLTSIPTAPGGSVNTSDPGFEVGYSFQSFASPNGEFIHVPDNYISGTTLNLSHTYVGTTLMNLGLTPGISWGASFPIHAVNLAGDIVTTSVTQSITFQAVPEANQIAMFGIVGLLFGVSAFCRRVL